ncbi:MAG: hypothetical protein RH942_00485 [Kiloniellaceae bacterium]
MTNDAFIAAINSLSDAGFVRLRKKAMHRAMGTGLEADDLLNEAIRRTLDEGGRSCPSDVPIDVYLDNAMRSIANGERAKYLRSLPSGDGHDEGSVIGSVSDCRPSPAEVALAKIDLEEIVRRIESIFAEDPQAQAIVIGNMEGWTPAEIKEVEPMDDIQFATARRRVRRTLEREFGGKKLK